MTEHYTPKDLGFSFSDSLGRLRRKELAPYRPGHRPAPFSEVTEDRGWLRLSFADGSQTRQRRIQPTRRLLLRGIHTLLTMAPDAVNGAKGPLGLVEDAAILLGGREIFWVGRSQDYPRGKHEEIDLGGVLCMPGLVDPHTHLVFAGERSTEYGLRLKGASYVEILEAGGGILSTVAATRAASEEELFALALPRLDRMLARGVTTCEAKSGYGLSLTDERKILRVTRALDAAHPIDLVPTLLAAHAIPAEHRAQRSAYVALVIDEIIPEIARERLATSCDVFCDQGAFTVEESRAVLEAAQQHGLKVRIHAEEIANTGAAAMGASLGALSADHLERLDADGAAALARAGTVAVLLPGAAITLGLPHPPIKLLREAGVTLAIGTDLNPGTSHLNELPLAASLAAGLFRLSTEEALLGITRHAAWALNLHRKAGEIRPGAKADIVAYDLPNAESLLYHFGQTAPAHLFAGGEKLF
jgi:imidazolonepropionase